MFKLSWVSLTFILLILILSQADSDAGFSAGIPPLPIVGEIGENAQAVDVEGNYAYVGFGNEFTVVDITDKGMPVQVGSLMMPEPFRWIQVRGTLAYVALENGLAIVDITQPTSPFSRDNFTETNVTHIEVQNPYAYLLAQTYLVIVDISDADEVAEIGRLQVAPPINYWFTDLAVDIPYLFATKYGGTSHGTWVVNINDPVNPIEVDHWPLIEGSLTAIRDDIFYNAYGNCHIYCPAVFVSYDVSDIHNPTQVNIVQNGDDFIYDLELGSDYAYTGSRIQLQVFALGTGGDAILGHSFAAEEVQDLAIEDGYVYLAAEPGLQIVLGPPYNPVYLPAITFHQ